MHEESAKSDVPQFWIVPVKKGGSMTRPEVLLIVKDGRRRREIQQQLQQAGCSVTTVPDAQQGVQQAVARLPDVVMLDQELPDVDGLEVCRRIRNRVKPGFEPVFLLTPDSKLDLPQSDSADGDGRSRQWAAIHAVISRTEAVEPKWTRVAVQGLEMDLRQHRAKIDGRELTLTPMEFRLLWTLASEPGNVYDREQLSRLCHRGKGSRRVRTIDVHVKAVRTKLGDRSDLVQTVHGVGYRFQDPASGVTDVSDRQAVCHKG
jgi:two-component system phosphate regulon response regulator PhoB